jgi:hypothetical protein
MMVDGHVNNFQLLDSRPFLTGPENAIGSLYNSCTSDAKILQISLNYKTKLLRTGG